MAHTKKIKFNDGRDANKMLAMKLAVNFIAQGTITTTEAKAKVLKSIIEKITEKAKVENEANKNYLLKKLHSVTIVRLLFAQIGPVFKGKTGGHVRVVKLHCRANDGAEMARLEWTLPVVLAKKETSEKTKKE